MNQEAYLDNPVDREQSGTDAPMFTLLPGQILKDTISNYVSNFKRYRNKN